VYVQEEVYERFMEVLKSKAEACAIGMVSPLPRMPPSLPDAKKPEDEKTSFGPLVSEEVLCSSPLANRSQISKPQHEKVLAYIDSGREAGAKILTGGGSWSGSKHGYYVQPTILADTTPDMKVVQEEVG